MQSVRDYSLRVSKNLESAFDGKIGLFFVIVHLRAGGFAHWRSCGQLRGRPPTSSLHAETAPIVSASTSRVFAQAVVVRFSGLLIGECRQGVDRCVSRKEITEIS